MPAGNRWIVLVPGERTGGQFAVFETLERRGSEPPRHLHSREDELVCVLEGHVTFEFDGEQIDGTSGTWQFLPRGKEHAMTVETSEARLLVLLSPAGFEGYLREIEQHTDAAADRQVIERVVTTAARYGVSIIVPARPGDPEDVSHRETRSERHTARAIERLIAQGRVNVHTRSTPVHGETADRNRRSPPGSE